MSSPSEPSKENLQLLRWVEFQQKAIQKYKIILLDKSRSAVWYLYLFSFCLLFLFFFLYALPCLFSRYLCNSPSLLFAHIGSLIQVPMSEKGKITRGRLGSLSLKKEGERQCFLFSKHLIICTRGSGGKLHLTKVGTHNWRLCIHWSLIRCNSHFLTTLSSWCWAGGLK